MSGSLDPEEWDEFRALCHAAVDDMVDWWEQVRERPVWRPMPDEVKAALTGSAPRHGADLAEVYRRFGELVLPYPIGNTHPCFMGWVHGAGTPAGAMAEFLAAALNPILGGREHLPVFVERQVVDWSRQIMGPPEDTSGLLVGGTSLATVIGLAAAGQAHAGGDVRRDWLQGRAVRLVGYPSREAHSCFAKAFELLGLGRDSLRLIPVDAEHRLGVAALVAAIAADRAAGCSLFALPGPPVRSTPVRSTIWPRWPACAATSGSGSMSTRPSVASPCWCPSSRRAWPAWNARTRWCSTSTNGCTSATRRAVS